LNQTEIASWESQMIDANQKICPECNTPNPADAQTCSNCGAPFAARTLSIKKLEIDDRDPTFRIMPAGGQPFTFRLNKKIVTIGKDENQDIKLTPEGVAGRHARVMSEGSSYRIFDITPGKGVAINGKAADSALLRDGDTISLQSATGETVATIAYSNPAERAMGTASIGKMYPLDKFPFIIGRDPNGGVKLEAMSISWHHAQIDQAGNGHTLTDLKSENGTFVNDRPVKGTVKLQPDDVIRVDKILFVYSPKGLQRLPSVQQFQLDGRDVEMTYTSGLIRRTTKNTLRDVSISIHPKEFVAIIGGSGSGKSTLLRALNGAARATGGKILINGRDLYGNYAAYQPLIGYVPQADIVQNNLSVRQVLTYAARLRFPNEPIESRNQRIDRALEDVELVDFQGQLVGSLSGGQKKRVSIALELMAEPGLLFMDEPSSGLDPGLDKSMMDLLRKLANQGHVVIIVTHTTLNIDLCDKLALVARGNLAYYGPPRDALTFFGVRNYSEIYNRVLQPVDKPAEGQKVSMNEAAHQWAEKFKASPLYATHVTNRLQPPVEQTAIETVIPKRLAGQRRGTFLQQTRVLSQRTLALVRRDIRTLLAMLLVLPLVGLFLGLISFETLVGKNSEPVTTRGQMLVSRGDEQTLLPVNASEIKANPNVKASPSPIQRMGTFSPANEAQRLLFMTSLSVVLLGLFTAAYTIVEERSLFLRERMVNLRIAPYVASKLLVYGGLSLVASLLFLIVLAVGVQLPAQGMFLPAPLELFITLALTALAGVSLGLLISTLTDKIDAATYAVLAVLLVQILFPGVLFKMDGVLKPLSQITITRWSLEALGATVNMNQRNAEGRIVIESKPVKNGVVLESAPAGLQIYPAPSALNLDYPNNSGELVARWGILALFTAIFMVGASVILDRSEPF
jgi:ABC-type multidrug transport system ATPase subunit/ribosomal protein L40E